MMMMFSVLLVASVVLSAVHCSRSSSLAIEQELQHLSYSTCDRMSGFTKESIIDIQKSLKHGAKLLDAGTSQDLLNCSNLCCSNPLCDLGVYKVGDWTAAGVNTGHNCFLIQCGAQANCKMAHHSEFIALMFNEDDNNEFGIGRENSPVRHQHTGSETDSNDSDSTETDSDSTKTDSDSTETDSHIVEINSTKTDSHTAMIDPHTTETDSDSTKTDSYTTAETKTSETDFHTTKTDPRTTETDPRTTKTDSGYSVSPIPTNTMLDEDKDKNIDVFINETYHHDDKHLPMNEEVDSCKIHGCNKGSGIIVIAVVGCVAVLVVFFVGIAVFRKLYSNKRKKHYHNVDYLINGMYT